MQGCDVIVSLLRAGGMLQRLDAIGLMLSPVAIEMLYSTASLSSLILCGVLTLNDDGVDKASADQKSLSFYLMSMYVRSLKLQPTELNV